MINKEAKRKQDLILKAEAKKLQAKRDAEEERGLAEIRGNMSVRTHPMIKNFLTMKQRDQESVQGVFDAYQKNEDKIVYERENDWKKE